MHTQTRPTEDSRLKDAHFIEWELSEGEIVIFDYRNFVGMSASITLSVLISMRVSTLLFDKIIYPTAKGPGKLILLTDGVPRVGDNDFTQSSMPSNRIVAWQKDILFHTVSELNFIDVYMSSTYIKKDGAGILVMDADKRGIPKNGLTRFIKHFFLP